MFHLRILVFGRESIRQHMHNVHTLYIDGTFAVCPPLFAQLVVVVGRRGNLVQPLLHALLPNRKQESYERLLTLIRQVKLVLYHVPLLSCGPY